MNPDQWQPIETAPRDTTDILVWDPEDARQLISFWACGQWAGPNDHTGYSYPLEPTHWQPLPGPPQS